MDRPMNRRVLLNKRPVGMVDASDFEFDEVSLEPLKDRQARLEISHLGIDPTIRTWLSTAKSYLPPIQIGEVIRSAGAGKIIESKHDKFKVGDVITTLTGWQSIKTVDDNDFATVFSSDTDPKHALGILGSSGLAAYVGMLDVGKPKEGQTVVVSAAAGATGSVAGQLAKIQGCRVVGIAGSDEKCAHVVDDLGFDACLNYKTEGFSAQLKEACPKRIDVYFDNVGGWILDEVLGRINMGARVVLCGAISVYNEATKPPGPANYLNLISMRGKMLGFNGMDHWGKHPQISAELSQWMKEGKLTYREHVVEGLDNAWRAVNMLFTGENIGKVLVEV